MTTPCSRLASFASVLIVAGLAGCSSTPAPVQDLTDPEHTEIVDGVAPLTRADARLPFHFATEDGLTSGYNLQRQEFPTGSFYCLRLVLRNEGEAPCDVTPTVEIRDANGLSMPLVPRDALVQAALATPDQPEDTDVADVVQVASPLASVFGLGLVGTAFSVVGSTFSAISGDGEEALTGADVARWAMTHWLKDRYAIPPAGAVAGVVAFEAPRTLPLHILITAGSRRYRFTSVTAEPVARTVRRE